MQICPKCHKEHEKLGQFCSRSCASSHVVSQETREKKAQITKRYYSDLKNRNKTSGAMKEYWQEVKAGLHSRHKADLTNRSRERRKQLHEKFQRGELLKLASVYKVLVDLHGNKCMVCPQEGEWNGKFLRMRVDHIDGNATNSSPGNFQLVCPNCDSQASTYCSRNRGKGRKSLGLPY